MKKLFLFILVLFCVLTSLSYADACNAQICTCPNGSWVTFGQYCSAVNTTPSYSRNYVYGAIAINEDNGYWFAVTNFRNAKGAENEVAKKCSETFNEKKCKVIPIKENKCLTVAYSPYDKTVKWKNGVGSKIRESLLKSAGKNYEIISSLCNYASDAPSYHWKDQY